MADNLRRTAYTAAVIQGILAGEATDEERTIEYIVWRTNEIVSALIAQEDAQDAEDFGTDDEQPEDVKQYGGSGDNEDDAFALVDNPLPYAESPTIFSNTLANLDRRVHEAVEVEADAVIDTVPATELEAAVTVMCSMPTDPTLLGQEA